MLSFPSIVYFSARADTLAKQIERVMVPRVLLKPHILTYLTDSRGSSVKSGEVRNCPVKYYCSKYATTDIVDPVRTSGHAHKKPEEIGHACLGNRV